MPELKPVPIATKKQGHTVWMHSVRKWKLTENWEYTIRESSTGKNEKVEIVIPKGFVFDGASVPRPLWAILHPSGLLLIPALVHDFAYRCGFLWEVVNPGEVRRYRYKSGCKEDWDELFRKIGIACNDVRIANYLAYFAVFLFGICAWNKNEKTRENAISRECSECKRPGCQCRLPIGYVLSNEQEEKENPDTER